MIPSVKLNEFLKRVLPVIATSDQDINLKRFVSSPYLTLTQEAFRDYPDVQPGSIFDPNGDFQTPFPVFRFCVVGSEGSLFGVVWRTDTLIRFVISQKTNERGFYDEWFFCSTNIAPSNKPRLNFNHDWASLRYSTLQWQNPDGAYGDWCRGCVTKSYDVLWTLIEAYTTPHNFVAKVGQQRQGKSVEWHQAREHYTVIHRRHPANHMTIKTGAVVNSDETKNSTRLAHSRIAHTRLLRSDRYKAKKGVRIQVRSTWCGPKEWQDTAGQTYKIVNIQPPIQKAE